MFRSTQRVLSRKKTRTGTSPISRILNTKTAVAAILLTVFLSGTATAGWIQPRIVGGTATTIAEYPWQVALLRTSATTFDSIYWVQSCGGTLISPQWVLTAAHCFAETRLPADWKVGVGITDLNQPAQGKIVAVSRIIINENYNPFTQDNDIAVMELEKPVDCSVITCKPIGLVDPDIEPYVVTLNAPLATATGWGSTNPDPLKNQYPAILQVVTGLQIVSNDECNTDYGGRITANMLCANKPGGDTCAGDSGGPLVVPSNDGTGYLEAGIVSFGATSQCATTIPGVYTRVSRYTSWIQDRMAGIPIVTSSGGGGGGAIDLWVLLLAPLLARRRPT